MKIYPSTHNIIQTDKVDLSKDIPLAYIDTQSTDYELTILDRTEASIKPVIPYTCFDSYDVTFFETVGEKTNNTSRYNKVDNTNIMQRIGPNTYQYIPENVTIFSPEEFNYQVIGKKNLKYDHKKKYNIKIGCIDDTITNTDKEKLLSRKLIKIFGDAADRNLAPNNIMINEKDISVYSLSNSSIKNLDFLFVQTLDGNSYKTSEGNKSNFNEKFLSNCTNLWISVKNFPVEINQETIHGSFNGINYPIYTDYDIKDTFLAQLEPNFKIDNEENTKPIIHTLSVNGKTCAYIKEYKDKGFIIYTAESFFEHIEQNYKVFYEILMYVYERTYLLSETYTEWITDNIPDYVVINNHLSTINEFSSNRSINEMFGLEKDEIVLSKCIIDKANIQQIDLKNNHLIFNKICTDSFIQFADPIKEEKQIAIYTPQKQIIYYDNMIYFIEDDLNEKMYYERKDNSYFISLSDYKSSSKNIAIEISEANEFEISLIKTVNYQQTTIDDTIFYVCCKDGIISYYDESTYYALIENTGYRLITRIQIKKTTDNSVVYDMRKRGGGLPASYEDDYNLLDIGNIYGLAYRKSGTIVVTLPKRLEVHKDIIYNVLSRHMVNEKLLVILFEDEE